MMVKSTEQMKLIIDTAGLMQNSVKYVPQSTTNE